MLKHILDIADTGALANGRMAARETLQMWAGMAVFLSILNVALFALFRGIPSILEALTIAGTSSALIAAIVVPNLVEEYINGVKELEQRLLNPAPPPTP